MRDEGGSSEPSEPHEAAQPKVSRERPWPFAILTTGWVLAGFPIVYAIAYAGLYGLHAANVSFAGSDPDVYAGVFSAIIYALLIGVTLGIPKRFKLWSGRISYQKLLGFTRLMAWRDIGLTLVGAGVYIVLWIGFFILVERLVPGFNANQAQDLGFTKSLGQVQAIVVFLTLVVVAPVCEEVIFRGYLLGTLRRIVPFWAAALLTSLAFATVHLHPESGGIAGWNVAVDVFALSLVSCVLRAKTGALWGSILLHMMKNALAFYVLYIATGGVG